MHLVRAVGEPQHAEPAPHAGEGRVVVAGWGTDEQGWYFAVELVQGVSLARLMKTVFDTGEMFTERLVVHIGATLCRGLSAAPFSTNKPFSQN